MLFALTGAANGSYKLNEISRVTGKMSMAKWCILIVKILEI